MPTSSDSTDSIKGTQVVCQIQQVRVLVGSSAVLGHVLTPKGISVDPSKVQDVLNWKSPKLVHQIRQFLGLAGYYRRFIPDLQNSSTNDQVAPKRCQVCMESSL